MVYTSWTVKSQRRRSTLIVTVNGLLSVLLGTVLSLLPVNEVETLGLEEVSDSSGGEASGDLLSLGMVLGLSYGREE